MAGRKYTRRRKAGGTRKQRGGQPKDENHLSLNLPTSLPTASHLWYSEIPNLPSLETAAAPAPAPAPIEQTPPSSLEFQIFFAKLMKLIQNANLRPNDLVKFVVILADLVKELYLNSDEIIRVLDIYEILLISQYEDVIGRQPRILRYNVYEALPKLIRSLKRSNQLLAIPPERLF